ncbi:MAG: hemolysin family protein [Anaerolineae bacterium]
MEILIILVLMILNGLFAMSEIAVVSARKVRLQQWASEGDARAGAALELANAPNRFLSTVQIGITLIGILAGAFGEATIAEKLAARLSLIPSLAPYSKAIGLGVVVLSITYLSLVIGELVPKRLGLHNPERVARAVAGPMRALSIISFPVVRLLSVSTDALLFLLGNRPSAEPPITEEEIKVLIEQGTQAGVFEPREQDMVSGVFRFYDRSVDALMTPRTEIVWLDVEDSPDEIRRILETSPYSRLPVGRGDLDNILGIVQVRDILARGVACRPVDVITLLQQPLFVPESTPASQLLELFKEPGGDMVLVIDEYGGLQGLVTVHDVIQEIIGDFELVRPQAVQRKDGSWLVDGMMDIARFKEMLQITKLPGEKKGKYLTVGGFVMMHLGRIPATGDQFRWAGFNFEVVDMDGKRVDKVLVTPIE